MHPLSIFNFDTYQADWRFSRWPLFLVLFACVGELVLRIPAVTQHLPPPEPTLWHATNVQTKLDYLRELQHEHNVDVLFVGNSTVLAGIDPEAFDHNRGVEGTNFAAFNGAIEGLPAYGALAFTKIYLHYIQPKVIVYGITPQDINRNSPSGQNITDKIERAPLTLVESGDSFSGWLLGQALDHSALFRYRFVLHQYLLSAGSLPAPVKIYFNKRGFVASNERLSDVSPPNRGVYYNKDGVLNYAPTGKQLMALQEMMTYCREHHVQLVLLNMPLSDNYYGNFRSPADYQAYLATVSQLAGEFNVPLWDMENLPEVARFNDDKFADFNHLNRFGAEKLSALLAERYHAVTKRMLNHEDSVSF